MMRLPISRVLIDEDFVFIFSVALLSFLFSLLMFMIVLIVWLAKIRHRVEQVIQAGTVEKKISSPFVNNAFSYSDVDLEEGGIDLKQTSFQVNGSNTVAEWSENVPCIEITDSEGLVSSSGQHDQGAQGGKRKIYKSLKNPTDADYAKLYEETQTKNACSDDAEDFIHNETDITDDQGYLVLIGEDADQSAKKLQESHGKDQQSGKAPKIKIDGLMDDDLPQNDYENEYLAVIHSETTPGLPEGTENVMPQHKDEAGYLVPIETVSTEKRQQRQGKDGESHSERKPKASVTLERDKRAQATAVAEGGVQMAENSYEYINSRVVKELRGSNSQEAQYINKESTVHNGDESKMPSNASNKLDNHGENAANSGTTELVQEQQNLATDEVYDVIRDGDNHGYLEVAARERTPEAIYQNQTDMEERPSSQNAAGVCSSDNGSIYADSIKRD